METHRRETEPTDAEGREPDIARRATGMRILLTVLFAVVWGVMEAALGVIVVFDLIWTLITRRGPPVRLRELSNRLVTYAYRIWRYVTYNETRVPFPLSDFPSALEPPEPLGHDEPPEVDALRGRDGGAPGAGAPGPE